MNMPPKKARSSTINAAPLVPPANAKKPVALTDLPLESLAHILSFTSPSDILTLRKCCRVLHIATKERSVWNGILPSVERECCIVPSYKPPDANIHDLEYAALAHHLIAHQFRHAIAFRPKRIAILTPCDEHLTVNVNDDDDDANSNSGFENFALVPGGRFLISFFGDLLELWDLGASARLISLNDSTAWFNVKGGIDVTLKPQVAVGEDGSLVVLVGTDVDTSHDGLNRLRAYYVDVGEQMPDFGDESSELTMSNGDYLTITNAHTITPRIFAFCYGERIVVWDFWNQKLVSLHAPEKYPIQELLISKDEKRLVVLYSDKFVVYDIPPLTYIPKNFNLSFDHPIASSLTEVISVTSPFSQFKACSANWSNNHTLSNGSMSFDLLGQTATTSTLFRYIVSEISSSDGFSSVLPRRLDSANDSTEAFCSQESWEEMKFETYSLARGYTLVLWVEGLYLWSKISYPRDAVSKEREFGKKRLLWKWKKNDVPAWSRLYAFDAFSGRLCVLSRRGEIRVMDYVEQPYY